MTLILHLHIPSFILKLLDLPLFLAEVQSELLSEGLPSIVEVFEAAVGLLRKGLHGLALPAHLGLRGLQIPVHLVNLIKSSDLALLVGDDIFVCFLDIIDSGLNLVIQISPQNFDIVLFLLAPCPCESLFFLLPDIHLLHG